jgi:electron transport complex protein RnfC
MPHPQVRGGLLLDGHKRRSSASPLRTATAPAQVVLPLDQHTGLPAIALVTPGVDVRMGQPVAQSQSDMSAWIHSPVSGRVLAIEPRPAPHHGGEPAPSIVIANDGKDEKDPSNLAVEFQSLDPVDLCEHIARGGIVGLGGATFPTAMKLLQARRAEHVHLILNGVECEPWISCDDVLMRERAQDVVLGARILCRALGASKCTVAIESDMPEAQKAIREALKSGEAHDIAVASVPSIYPAGGERQLITTLTGLEVPADGLPSDIGMVCQNVGTAAAVARWIRDGEPLIRRIVTLTGSGVREPINLEVRIGTLISDLIASCGGYQSAVTELIMGGSMMGAALPRDDVPVIKGTNCVIAATSTDFRRRGTEMPCIRCGDCAKVCPAALLPQQLHWYAHNDLGRDLPALQRHGLLECIECGCCDHVCPSQIPLAQRFREAKPSLLEALDARARADDSRVRFESREQRLARLEDERRAKLEEKRKALKNPQ